MIDAIRGSATYDLHEGAEVLRYGIHVDACFS